MDARERKRRNVTVAALGAESFMNSGMNSVKALVMPLTIQRIGCTSSQLTLTTTIMMTVQFVTSFFAGKLLKKLGPAKCISLYALIEIVYIGCYLKVSGSLLPIYILAGLVGAMFSCGSSAGTNVLMAEWFDEDRARATSLVFAATSAGGTLTSLAVSVLGKGTDPEALYFRIYCVFSALTLVCLLLIRRPSGIGEREAGAGPERPAAAPENGPSSSEVARSPVFHLFCLAVLVYSLGTYMSFAFTIIIDGIGFGEYASLIYTGYSLCNTLMHLLAGRTFSRFGSRAIFLHLGLMAASFVLLILGSGTGSLALVVLAIVLFSAGNSGTGMISVVSYPELLGMRSYSQLMPVVLGCSFIASGVSPALMSYLSERSGSWKLPFALSGSVMLISIAIWAVLFRLRARKEDGTRADVL